jgi:hypothetical protein
MKLAIFIIILIINVAHICSGASLNEVNESSMFGQKMVRPEYTNSKPVPKEEILEPDFKSRVYRHVLNTISKILRKLELKVAYTAHISNDPKNKKVIFVPSDKNLNHYFIG